VPIKTLDQLIATYGRPKYIKIDVEGYELPVIGGMHAKIDLISFEYHLNKDDCAAKLQIIEYLKQVFCGSPSSEREPLIGPYRGLRLMTWRG